MQQAGQQCLREAGLQQYEVSAYARTKNECHHNLNYWEFADYLGIGAGAHSKLTDHNSNEIFRFAQVKHPRDYLNAAKRQALSLKIISETDSIFEFMLNALRLTNGVPNKIFIERTGLSLSHIEPILKEDRARNLLTNDPNRLCASEH